MSKHKHGTRDEEDNNQQANQSLSSFNLGSLTNIVNSIDINSLVDAINSAAEAIDNRQLEEAEDESGSAEIIRALRTLINTDKVLLLQTIIQIYALSRARKK